MAQDGTGMQLTVEARDELLRQLAGDNRRARQQAAHELARLSRGDVSMLLDVTDQLIAALSMPEAQTRWECLDVLTQIAVVRPEDILDAFPGAEDSLFDELSASARLSAFRFLCRYGAIASECSLEAWPLIGEAIRCYHGDPEYRNMLIALLDFAQGDIEDEVAADLVDLMQFDATNGKGFARSYSQKICSILTKGK